MYLTFYCAVGSMVMRRGGFVSFSGDLVLFGGESYDGKSVRVYGDLFKWDLDKSEWRRLEAPEMPKARCSHQAVYHKYVLYRKFHTGETHRLCRVAGPENFRIALVLLYLQRQIAGAMELQQRVLLHAHFGIELLASQVGSVCGMQRCALRIWRGILDVLSISSF